jgi:hypothetical protein
VKVDKKYSPLLFGAIMAGIMGFVISLLITLINIGPAPNFFEAWARAYGVSFAIALPTAIGVSQIARKLVARMTR